MSICLTPDDAKSILQTLRAVGSATMAEHLQRLVMAEHLQRLIEEAESPHALQLADRARSEYGSDDCEVDDVTSISEGDDGTWVCAWVFLADTDDTDE